MAVGSGFSSNKAIQIRTTEGIGAPKLPSGPGPNFARADMLDKLSRGVSLIGHQFLEREAEQEKAEAIKAGEEAGYEAARTGQAPELVEPGFFTRRRDMTQNEATESAYAQGMESKISTRQTELATEHEADPDGFKQSWDQYSSDVIKNTPPHLRSRFAFALENQGTRATTVLQGQKQDRVDAQKTYEFKKRTDQLSTDAANNAYATGDEEAAADYLFDLDASLKEQIAAGNLSDAEATSLWLNTRGQVTEASIMGSWDRAPTRENYALFLESDHQGMTPERKRVLADGMERDLSRLKSQADAEYKRRGNRAKNYIEGRKQGMTYDPADEAAIKQEAVGTEWEYEVNKTGEMADRASAIAGLTPQERRRELALVDQDIKALQETPIPEEEQEDALFALDQLTTYRELVADSLEETGKAIEDGNGLLNAHKRGLINLTNLDDTNDQTLGASIDARVNDAELVEQHEEVAPGTVSPFLQEEVDHWVVGMQPDAVGSWFGFLFERVGPEHMPTVMGQVAASPRMTALMNRIEETDDPVALQQAMAFVQAQREYAPQVAEDLKVGSRLENALDYQERLGLPADQAAQRAIDQSKVSPEVAERRSAELKGEGKMPSGKDLIQGGVSGSTAWFGDDAYVPDKVLDDAEKTYRTFYGETGNATAATKLTQNRLREKYGVTGIGGVPSVMELPPERYLPGAFDAETRTSIIDEDIRKGFEQQGITIPEPPVGMEVTPDYKLVPDAQTRREEKTNNPSYQVWLRDEFGNYSPMDDRYRVPGLEDQKGLTTARLAQLDGRIATLNKAIASESTRISVQTQPLSGIVGIPLDGGDPAELARLTQERDALVQERDVLRPPMTPDSIVDTQMRQDRETQEEVSRLSGQSIAPEDAPVDVTENPEETPQPKSPARINLATGETSTPTTVKNLATGEVTIGDISVMTLDQLQSLDMSKLDSKQSRQVADRAAKLEREAAKGPAVGDISKMTREQLLALNMKVLTDEQLIAVTERDEQLRHEALLKEMDREAKREGK